MSLSGTDVTPLRDSEEEPEHRPELHYRDDLKAALSTRHKKSKQAPPISARGTATIGVLLPKIEVERDKRPVKRRKGKTAQKDLCLIHLETETQYESPKDVRDIDHTKLYAHSYREEGKYGSHPSHDGFDDESNP